MEVSRRWRTRYRRRDGQSHGVSKEAGHASLWGEVTQVKEMPADLPLLAKVPTCTRQCSAAFKDKPGFETPERRPEESYDVSLLLSPLIHIYLLCLLESEGHQKPIMRSVCRGLTPIFSHTTSGNLVLTHNLSLPVVARGKSGVDRK